jgi:GT2 family glycosyltransferase
MTRGPEISVVMVSHNSSLDLARSLPPLVRDPGLEVLVIDAASTDSSVSVARGCGANVLEQSENVGWTKGCAIGAALATADVLAFVNPDATPSAADLRALAERLELGAAVVFPAYVDDTGATQAFYFRFPSVLDGAIRYTYVGRRIDHLVGDRVMRRSLYDGQPWDHDPDYAGAACLVTRASTYRELDGLDVAMWLFFSDTDFCRRIRLSGRRIDIAWDVEVRHSGGGSVRRLSADDLSEHVLRDYATYARKWYGPVGRAITDAAVVLLVGIGPAAVAVLRGSPRQAARAVSQAVRVLTFGRRAREDR